MNSETTTEATVTVSFKDSIVSEWRLYAAILAAASLGFGSISVQPVLVGVMVDSFGMDASEAGLLVAFEVATMALANVLGVVAISRFRLLHIALMGAVVALVGHFLSSFYSTFEPLVVTRVLAGMGAGLCLAGGMAAIATLKETERVLALLTIALSLIGVLLLALLPLAVDWFGPSHAFTALVVAYACFMFFLKGLPENTSTDNNQKKAKVEKITPQAWPAIVAIMLSVFFLTLGHGVYWPFVQEIARATALPDGNTAAIISASLILGIIGGALATWMGLRFGRTLPIHISSAVIAISLSLSVWVSQAVFFVLLFYLYTLVYYFIVPYQKALFVLFDKSGRALSASGIATILALAVGPGIGGYSIDQWGLQGITYIAFPAHVASLLLLVWAVSKLPKETDGEGEANEKPGNTVKA